MIASFEYREPYWLGTLGACIAMTAGICISIGAESLALKIIAGIMILLGILGTMHSLVSRGRYWKLREGVFETESCSFQMDDVTSIERKISNEMVFYWFELSDGRSIKVKVPYLPWKEGEIWVALDGWNG